MNPYNLRRSKSYTKITKSSHNPQEEELLWCDWVCSPSLNYLNLIDFDSKKSYTELVPWFNCPYTQAQITEFCLKSVFKLFKTILVEKITISDDDIALSKSVQKLLKITKLFKIIYDATETSHVYYNIVYSLFDRKIEDPYLILTVWNTLCVQHETQVGVFSHTIGRYRSNRSAKLLEYIIKTAQSVRFDFWGVWTQKQINFNYCPVTAALLNGNVEQIFTLLQYGFLPNSMRLSNYDRHFGFYDDYLYDWLRAPVLENEPPRRKLVVEVLMFLVCIASTSSRSKQISMAECFRLLWSVMPIPFITYQELIFEVQNQFMHPPLYKQLLLYPNTEQDFFQLCDFYANDIMGENCITSEPRSLKHLSKCVIRSQLTKTWSLPSGIEQLPIPPHLKSYLNVVNCLQL